MHSDCQKIMKDLRSNYMDKILESDTESVKMIKEMQGTIKKKNFLLNSVRDIVKVDDEKTGIINQVLSNMNANSDRDLGDIITKNEELIARNKTKNHNFRDFYQNHNLHAGEKHQLALYRGYYTNLEGLNEIENDAFVLNVAMNGKRYLSVFNPIMKESYASEMLPSYHFTERFNLSAMIDKIITVVIRMIENIKILFIQLVKNFKYGIMTKAIERFKSEKNKYLEFFTNALGNGNITNKITTYTSMGSFGKRMKPIARHTAILSTEGSDMMDKISDDLLAETTKLEVDAEKGVQFQLENNKNILEKIAKLVMKMISFSNDKDITVSYDYTKLHSSGTDNKYDKFVTFFKEVPRHVKILLFNFSDSQEMMEFSFDDFFGSGRDVMVELITKGKESTLYKTVEDLNNLYKNRKIIHAGEKLKENLKKIKEISKKIDLNTPASDNGLNVYRHRLMSDVSNVYNGFAMFILSLIIESSNYMTDAVKYFFDCVSETEKT